VKNSGRYRRLKHLGALLNYSKSLGEIVKSFKVKL
jgi:hypothetical protein